MSDAKTTNSLNLSEEERIIFLKSLVQLARADGLADNDEKKFIIELAKTLKIDASKADEVKKIETDEDIVKMASKITNRHTAMELIKEMCMLANSDGDLSDQEILLIGRIGTAMGLELEKIEQISQWVIDHIVWLEEGKIIFEKV